jgi:hypothetical protein
MITTRRWKIWVVQVVPQDASPAEVSLGADQHLKAYSVQSVAKDHFDNLVKRLHAGDGALTACQVLMTLHLIPRTAQALAEVMTSMGSGPEISPSGTLLWQCTGGA